MSLISQATNQQSFRKEKPFSLEYNPQDIVNQLNHYQQVLLRAPSIPSSVQTLLTEAHGTPREAHRSQAANGIAASPKTRAAGCNDLRNNLGDGRGMSTTASRRNLMQGMGSGAMNEANHNLKRLNISSRSSLVDIMQTPT